MVDKITQKRLKQHLKYSKKTGRFRWRVKTGKGVAGTIAGTDTRGDGYIQIQVRGRCYLAHHLVWLYMTGEFPEKGTEIDHKNGVRDDNRWTNLRCIPKADNRKNRQKDSRNTTGYTGISWYKPSGKWRVRIGDKNNQIHVGHYRTIEQAIQARNAAELKYGFHPNHGKTKEVRSAYDETPQLSTPSKKLKLFYSGSTSGESLPEQALKHIPASLMLTFFEVITKRGDTKTRFFRHERKRRPQ